MKKVLLSFLLFVIGIFTLHSEDPFSNIPKDSWVYKSLQQLVQNGVLKKDDFKKNSQEVPLTRYEAAILVAKVLERVEGLRDENFPKMTRNDIKTMERLTIEFADELALLGVRLEQAEKDIKGLKKDMAAVKKDVAHLKKVVDQDQFGKINLSGKYRVRIDYQHHSSDKENNDWRSEHRVVTNMFAKINDKITTLLKIKNDFEWSEIGLNNYGTVEQLIVQVKDFFNWFDVKLGRQHVKLGHGIVLNDNLDGIKVDKQIEKVHFSFLAFSKGTDDNGITKLYPYDKDYEYKQIAAPAYAYNASDNIVFHYTPDKFPQFESDLVNNKNNNYSGTSLSYEGVTHDMVSVLNAPAPTFTATQQASSTDSDGKHYQNVASASGSYLERDWNLKSKNGFSTVGINLDYEFKGHKISFYTLWDKYEKFDPYTRMGDPFLTLTDYDYNKTIDATSPEKSTTYWGFTLDGNIFPKVNYFFEFANFNPSLDGSFYLDRDHPFDNGKYKAWDPGTGSVWMLGGNWEISKQYKLTAMYASGDELFVPSSIYYDYRFLNMGGRWNPNNANLYSPYGDLYGTGSLQGINDFLLKFSFKINPKLDGYLQYENVSDNDSDHEILISGDPKETGHPSSDYNFITARINHHYSKNTRLALEFSSKLFSDDNIDNAAGSSKDSGGWSRIRTELEVKF
jgi:hypothetical protein